jgi:hypothetical protein
MIIAWPLYRKQLQCRKGSRDARNVDMHAMVKVMGIVMGQLILERNTMRLIRKKVRLKMRLVGKGVNIRGMYN